MLKFIKKVQYGSCTRLQHSKLWKCLKSQSKMIFVCMCMFVCSMKTHSHSFWRFVSVTRGRRRRSWASTRSWNSAKAAWSCCRTRPALWVYTLSFRTTKDIYFSFPQRSPTFMDSVSIILYLTSTSLVLNWRNTNQALLRSRFTNDNCFNWAE